MSGMSGTHAHATAGRSNSLCHLAYEVEETLQEAGVPLGGVEVRLPIQKILSAVLLPRSLPLLRLLLPHLNHHHELLSLLVLKPGTILVLGDETLEKRNVVLGWVSHALAILGAEGVPLLLGYRV